ncbi:hypothetical protein HPP92_015771 [Vanilla planifolia]|uniref:RRM domain-containing protein n=1 Tax=Vanilla planifolia TaxID=51239 RepID=A0A835QJS9_VANPL|nr:hypothetical protein HPP92_015771 [Vanilla planifolia]
MGDADCEYDDRTFRANFVGDSAARLRDRVKDKLKEFMGDYTDDTLVEYVIVLLRNGRRKEEAKRELNVFLGDDSGSFVTWLWDHLSLNLNLYIQTKESLPDEMAIKKEKEAIHFGSSSTQVVQESSASRTDSEHEDGKLVDITRSRRNREWKGLMGEMSGSFSLRSTVIDALQSGEKSNRRSDVRSFSPPSSQIMKKRSREYETQPTKRDADVLPKLAPSRRLLEFAVRDAVKTAQQPTSKAEPALKRLRSMISTSKDTMFGERPQRTRSTLRMSGSMSVALKAAAEAAEDVTRSRNAGSVFDRLGHDRATVEPIELSSDVIEPILDDGVYREFDQIDSAGQVEYQQKDVYDDEVVGNSSMFVRDAEISVDSASDNDSYDDFGVSNDHVLDASQYSAIEKDNSVMLHYDVSKGGNEVVRKTRFVQQDVPPSASAKPSSKIVNISVNVNTWKPPEYQVSKDANKNESRKPEGNEGASVKPNVNVGILKESSSSIAGNGKDMLPTVVQKEPLKPMPSTPGVSYATSRPSEDVDSRTIFLTNVHFAANKDTLSRHFNKFGEVLKVIIVTDPATGQPIGSAYVEFLRKESAELALSLNGTSFMSRILKVARRSSVEASVMGWPRVSRASPFASGLGRMPFPRGIMPTAFRTRLPVKPGARSLQWKRDTAAALTTEGAKSIQISPRNTGRNLTYVRPESKV